MLSGDMHHVRLTLRALQDEPQAQQLLENWPQMCKDNDIPCSGMHLSSGYTVGEEDGNRYVFTMNK